MPRSYRRFASRLAVVAAVISATGCISEPGETEAVAQSPVTQPPVAPPVRDEASQPYPPAPPNLATAPATPPEGPGLYEVSFETTKGTVVVEVHRDWAPNGAHHFYDLVTRGFYNDVKFFRVVPNFMVQFGINGNPNVSSVWSEATLIDDPVRKSNKRGYITYAKTGRPNSRSTQVFINFTSNAFLDSQGFAPFGEVIKGMDVVDSLESRYNEQPSQRQFDIQTKGNKFLDAAFPGLDHIVSATVTSVDGRPVE
ncbi:MAG: peptidylprolyl isomerase [Planctomycetota bacterium]